MQTGQHGLKGNLISEDKVRAAVDSALCHRIPDDGKRRQATDLLIEQLTGRNYILCHVGGAQFAFVHRGFLEYFASEYLLNIVTTRPKTAIEEIGDIYCAHSNEDAWREVLILAATRFDASVADKILFPLICDLDLENVFDAYWGPENKSPIILVCSILGRAREANKIAMTSAHARASIENMIRIKSSNHWNTIWADILVSTFGGNSARAFLLDIFHSGPSSFAKGNAIGSLADHFRDADMRVLLDKEAGTMEDTPTRRQAVASLAKHFGDEKTRTLLDDLARTMENTQTRRQAVASLAEHFGDEKTRALLDDLARGPEDTQIRRQAVASLAEHFADNKTRALLEMLAVCGQDTKGSKEAIVALVRYFGDNKTRIILERLARSEEDTQFRRQAIDSLALKFGDDKTRTLLEECARREENTIARSQAIVSLAEKYGDSPEVRQLLLEILANQEGRNVIKQGLKLIKRPKVRKLFESLLGIDNK